MKAKPFIITYFDAAGDLSVYSYGRFLLQSFSEDMIQKYFEGWKTEDRGNRKEWSFARLQDAGTNAAAYRRIYKPASDKARGTIVFDMKPRPEPETLSGFVDLCALEGVELIIKPEFAKLLLISELSLPDWLK